MDSYIAEIGNNAAGLDSELPLIAPCSSSTLTALSRRKATLCKLNHPVDPTVISTLEDHLSLVGSIELYCRDDLVRSLGCDAALNNEQLVLYAFRRWGTEAFVKLVGDFSFVLHDTATGDTYGVVDHFGVVPLFFAQRDDDIVLSPLVRWLLKLHGISEDYCREGLTSYLLDGWYTHDLTAYQDIRAVPPGHFLHINGGGGHSLVRYYNPKLGELIRYKDPHEYYEHYAQLLDQAVHTRLSQSGTAIAVSGGLDSSAIVASSYAGMDPARITAYASAYPDPSDDSEAFYLEKLEHSFESLNIDRVTPPVEDFLAAFENDYINHGACTTGCVEYVWTEMLQRASGDGARVLLTGLAGDSCVSSEAWGYEAQLLRQLRLPTLFRLLKADGSQSKTKLRWLIRNALVVPLTPKPLRNLYIRAKGRSPYGKSDILGENLAPIATEKWLATHGRDTRLKPNPRQNELEMIMRQTNVRSFDWMSIEAQRFGIDIRHPFTDLRLLEFCMNVPTEIKVSNGYRRGLIRSYLDGKVDEKITWRRSKGPMGGDHYNRMKAAKTSLEDLLTSGPKTSTLVNKEYLASLVDDFASLPVRALMDHEHQNVLVAGLAVGHFETQLDRKRAICQA